MQLPEYNNSSILFVFLTQTYSIWSTHGTRKSIPIPFHAFLILHAYCCLLVHDSDTSGGPWNPVQAPHHPKDCTRKILSSNSLSSYIRSLWLIREKTFSFPFIPTRRALSIKKGQLSLTPSGSPTLSHFGLGKGFAQPRPSFTLALSFVISQHGIYSGRSDTFEQRLCHRSPSEWLRGLPISSQPFEAIP